MFLISFYYTRREDDQHNIKDIVLFVFTVPVRCTIEGTPIRSVFYEEVLSMVAEKYKPPMLADSPSAVIFLFSARNFAAPQDKSKQRREIWLAKERNPPAYRREILKRRRENVQRRRENVQRRREIRQPRREILAEKRNLA